MSAISKASLEVATAAVLDILNVEAIAFPMKPKTKRLAKRLAQAALTAASGVEAESNTQPTYYLTETWSAEPSRDRTHLVPRVRISGVGISPRHSSKVMPQDSVDAQTRMWMEEYGRIEKGAAFFQVEAPFRLVALSTQESAALAGDGKETRR